MASIQRLYSTLAKTGLIGLCPRLRANRFAWIVAGDGGGRSGFRRGGGGHFFRLFDGSETLREETELHLAEKAAELREDGTTARWRRPHDAYILATARKGDLTEARRWHSRSGRHARLPKEHENRRARREPNLLGVREGMADSVVEFALEPLALRPLGGISAQACF
jgi:hypothetical protein